jgi:hypothetical protein
VCRKPQISRRRKFLILRRSNEALSRCQNHVILVHALGWPRAGVKCLAQGLATMTRETNAAVEKLKRIQQLWRELGRTKASTPEYEMLLTKIRTMSAEYEALLPAPEKPKRPNN